MPKIGIKAAIEVTPQGARFPEGWVRVSRAEGNSSTLHFDAEFYASETAFDLGFQPLLTRSFTIPYLAGDLVTLLHNHLMTLNLDETNSPNPYSRLKCDLSAGELIIRPDPELPEGEAIQPPAEDGPEFEESGA
jgi:hypothetical protein